MSKYEYVTTEVTITRKDGSRVSYSVDSDKETDGVIQVAGWLVSRPGVGEEFKRIADLWSDYVKMRERVEVWGNGQS